MYVQYLYTETHLVKNNEDFTGKGGDGNVSMSRKG